MITQFTTLGWAPLALAAATLAPASFSALLDTPRAAPVTARAAVSDEVTDEKAPALPPLSDATIAPYQRELIELAYRSASAFPMFPHVKTRSKVQQDVLTTALELDQAKWVLESVASLQNWRRGFVYAELAHYAAEKRVGEVEVYLASAERVAADVQARILESDKDSNQVQVEMPQSWHRDRIQVRVLQTRALLGQDPRNYPLAADADESEVAKLRSTQARLSDPAAFQAEMEIVDRIVAGGVFDQVRAALDSCVVLYDRFHDDVERRAALREKVKASWSKLPIDIRIDLLLDMADVSNSHADKKAASALVDTAQTITNGAVWLPEHHVPVLARIARTRHACGEAEEALQIATAAREQYETKRESIVDIQRADTLLPLAETFLVMGDVKLARQLYARVVEEGAVNPNARPRCEDLVATCLSLARHRLEPDAETWKRLRAVATGLRDPW